ncbi:MAG: hypothetical protein AAB733_00355 [Patescibacteria group bacterium]
MPESLERARPNEEPSAQFNILPGREFDGDPAGYFLHSNDAELDSAIRSLGGDEALDYYVGSSRTSRQIKSAAEALADQLSHPEIQAKILELGQQKRELVAQIRALDEQYEALVQK